MIIDRVSTFSDPEIIELLKTKFVAVAIDQAYQRRQKDAEGEFYRKICLQGPRHDFEHGTTQGLYTCTADGKLLGYNNNRNIERHKNLLMKALKQYQPGDTPTLEAGNRDPRFDIRPPEGGLVVKVTSKVLGGYEKTASDEVRMFQSSLGRDHLWIKKDEHEALAKGELPESLKRRLARCHLEDNTRGEPNFWDFEDLKKVDLTLAGGKLSGSVHLETSDAKRGYEADLLGFVEAKDGKVVRFDLVARGHYWGASAYTGGAPKGRYPFAVAFTLVSGTDETDRIPPQCARGWINGYYRARD